jgi:hypothetical protein
MVAGSCDIVSWLMTPPCYDVSPCKYGRGIGEQGRPTPYSDAHTTRPATARKKASPVAIREMGSTSR